MTQQHESRIVEPSRLLPLIILVQIILSFQPATIKTISNLSGTAKVVKAQLSCTVKLMYREKKEVVNSRLLLLCLNR